MIQRTILKEMQHKYLGKCLHHKTIFCQTDLVASIRLNVGNQNLSLLDASDHGWPCDEGYL